MPTHLLKVCCVVALAATAASARTLRVPTAYPTIQAAINAARDGDVVLIFPGTYHEAALDTLGKAITVRSRNPLARTSVEQTIIDAQAVNRVFDIRRGEGPDTVIAGLTLLNGIGRGGGISAWRSSPTIHHNIIRGGNSGEFGGGVYLEQASSVVEYNTIEANRCGIWPAAGRGGGICISGGAPVVRHNRVIKNFSNYYGGGIYVSEGAATVEDNVVFGNEAQGQWGAGGGISLVLTDGATVRNNRVTFNVASGEYGGNGGIWCYQCVAALIEDNDVNHNNAKGAAGIGCSEDSSLVVRGNRVWRNCASGSVGGLWVDWSGSPLVEFNTLCQNESRPGTAANLMCSRGEPRVRSNIIAFAIGGAGVAGATPDHFAYNDVYANAGGNYLDIDDQTGDRGNMKIDPLFACRARGDFHVRSTAGRWDPVERAWVLDTVTSLTIDTGDPDAPFDREPLPNGGRSNMGAYGDTEEASKSPEGWTPAMLALTMSAAPVRRGGAQLTVVLSAPAQVQLRFRNLAGRVIAVMPERSLSQGTSALVWDGRALSGLKAPAGRYTCEALARGKSGSVARSAVVISLQ